MMEDDIMVKGNKMFAGLIAGAAVGTAVGLLFAPKPGRESRRVVATQADEMRHKAGNYVEKVRSWKKSKEAQPVMSGSANGHANGAT